MDEHLGIVLIAHGSRRAEANDDLFALAERMRDNGYRHVYASFLEIAAPDIVTAGRECAAAGARLIVLVPYFLSAGRHVTEDLNAARDRLSQLHPGVVFRIAPPLGPHPLLDQIVIERVREAFRQ